MKDRVSELFHNPDGKFTTAQRDAFVKGFGDLAGSMKDSKGRPLFKAYQNGRGITLANGDSLLGKLLDMVENPLQDIAGIKLSAAWHGSPHDFDKFSLDAIGTGEGAQAHGWGLYFAREREVSEGYRERVLHIFPVRWQGFSKHPWSAVHPSQRFPLGRVEKLHQHTTAAIFPPACVSETLT